MKAISIYITEDEHESAKKKAKRADLSLSQLVRRMLRDFNPSASQK